MHSPRSMSNEWLRTSYIFVFYIIQVNGQSMLGARHGDAVPRFEERRGAYPALRMQWLRPPGGRLLAGATRGRGKPAAAF